jgi:hypothetical protein
VVVGQDDHLGLPKRFEAFVWDAANGLRSLRKVLELDYGLDLYGWTVSEAAAVSADGRVVVGHAFDSANRRRAFRATLPPRPGLGSVRFAGTLASFARGGG